MEISTPAANPLIVAMGVVSHEFGRLAASVTVILVDRVILDKACLIQGTRFSRSKDTQIMIIKGTTFFEYMIADSRISALARRKSRPRPIMVTPPVSLLHFMCSNTSYSKLRCALFSLSDSQKPTAPRSAIKLAPERQRISIVRHSGMSWNTFLNLDNSIVMPTFPPH